MSNDVNVPASEELSPKAPASGLGAIIAIVIAKLAGDALNVDVDSGVLETAIVGLIAAVGAVVGAFAKRDPRRV